MTYRVIAIPTKTAEKVRATMKSPGYGHPAHVETATGYGPCRHCLKEFRVGEERRILFTLDPFYELVPLPLPGPVFVHAEPCERYDERAGFPEQTLAHALTLVAYGDERKMLAEERVVDGNVDPALGRFLADPEVRYVHVRDTEAGCYDFRIER
jgi:hypothetical protein